MEPGGRGNHETVKIDCGYRADFIVDLKLANCPRGLLINFNVKRLMDGVKSVLRDNLDNSAHGGSTLAYPHVAQGPETREPVVEDG